MTPTVPSVAGVSERGPHCSHQETNQGHRETRGRPQAGHAHTADVIPHGQGGCGLGHVTSVY